MDRKSFVIRACAVLAVVFMGCAAVVVDARQSCAFGQGNACAASCRSAYNDCRIATKGSASCDAQFQACLQGCVRR